MWALFFIAILYLTAPATAAFARYFMIESLNGATTETLPAWYNNWEQTGLIYWLDDGDGVVRYSAGEDNEIFRTGSLSMAEMLDIQSDHQDWINSNGNSGTDGRQVLTNMGLSGPDRDITVLATPEMAELSAWIIAFLAAGVWPPHYPQPVVCCW